MNKSTTLGGLRLWQAQRPRWARWTAALLLALLWLALGPGWARDAAATASPRSPAPALDEPASHLDCAQGYTATFYAVGLRSPDGLAFGPDGALYVVEESARRVSRINGDRSTTRVLSRLRSPEGATFDNAGNLYVVEDVRNGRLIRMSPDGQSVTLAEGLSAPEDVVVGPSPDGEGSTTLYVTQSNVEFELNPFKLYSGITAVSTTGETRSVIAHTPRLRGLQVAFWSYAGLTTGPDGLLYVTNELSGLQITRPSLLFTGRLTSTAKLLAHDSVFGVDPIDGTRTVIASELLAPEGLSFSADGDFPLYVAEENVGRKGRLSRIERDGRRTTVCDNFRGIEDVVVDDHGDLYVSEDRGGSIIRIAVSETVDTNASAPPPGSDGDPDPAIGRLRRVPDRVLAMLRRLKARFF